MVTWVAAKPPLWTALDIQLDGQAKRVQAGADRSLSSSGIDQGGEGHVAADAAETVKM